MQSKRGIVIRGEESRKEIREIQEIRKLKVGIKMINMIKCKL